MSSLVPTARACALFSFRRVEAEAPTKQWAHAASFDLPENPSTLWQRGERETTQLDENGSRARYPKLNGCDVEAIRVMEELGRLEDGTRARSHQQSRNPMFDPLNDDELSLASGGITNAEHPGVQAALRASNLPGLAEARAAIAIIVSLAHVSRPSLPAQSASEPTSRYGRSVRDPDAGDRCRTISIGRAYKSWQRTPTSSRPPRAQPRSSMPWCGST